ncbi:hypothetical protein ACN76_05190 [Escherichia coli]|nr:hypothetical protein ACN76_05190 [Escherichia coli]
MGHIRPDFPEPFELPVDGLHGKKCIFSHPFYLFFREFNLQDFRGRRLNKPYNQLKKKILRVFRVIADYDKLQPSGCLLRGFLTPPPSENRLWTANRN